jgi:hypothetical protein
MTYGAPGKSTREHIAKRADQEQVGMDIIDLESVNDEALLLSIDVGGATDEMFNVGPDWAIDVADWVCELLRIEQLDGMLGGEDWSVYLNDSNGTEVYATHSTED